MNVPRAKGTSPAETVDLHRKLRAWARQVESGASNLTGDLAEIHGAAREIVNSIELLAKTPPPDSASSRKELVNLDAWINDELLDHIESLNTTLSDVIDSLYGGD